MRGGDDPLAFTHEDSQRNQGEMGQGTDFPKIQMGKITEITKGAKKLKSM